MDEYIKRADALKNEEIFTTNTGREISIVRVHHINDIPAADVVERTKNTVEVVRCIDCRFGLPLKAHADCVDGLNCSIGRGEEVRNVWHKYSKHYEDYSLVNFDGFCDKGEVGEPSMERFKASDGGAYGCDYPVSEIGVSALAATEPKGGLDGK